jgi:signal transduction histidine kinase
LLDGYLAFARSGTPARLPVQLALVAARTAARWPHVRYRIPSECTVLGDELLLERVFDNLVDNAVRAGARSVDIGAETCGGNIVIRVSDDGPGVPADARPHIFAPGFSTRGSSGLGLAIIAETVAAHGGSIRCEAGAVGSCFVIELPLLTPAAST